MFQFSKWAAIRVGVSVIALAIAGAGVPALAQPGAGDATSQGPGLSEIVVTAQKRETKLQKTPISISVMKSADLTNRHVISLEDLGDGSIPSLRVAPFFARNSALTIGVRGVGVQGDANQPARDQAVGVYVDGVYLGRAQGLGSALYDIDHIEVLKGPQGTLFGRNTEGGAISIVTRQPSGVFRANVTAGYGDYNGYKTEAHVDLPSYDNVSIKLDGLLDKRDGLVKNPNSSGQPDFDSYDKRGFHGEALWKPTDAFSADYAYDVSYDGTTPYYVQLTKHGSLALAPLIQLQPDRATTANVGVPLQPSVGNTYGHRLTLDWRPLNNLEVKSISAYRKLTESQYDNGEENLSVYAPNGTFSRYSLAHTWQDQYSEELQLIGQIPTLQYVAGALYYHEAARDNAQTPNSLQWNATGTGYSFLPLNLNTVSLDRADHVTTQSIGAFAQATWTPPVLNDISHLTVGGRWTQDKKDGSLDVVNGALPSYINSAGQTVVGIIPLDKTWSRFDPMVTLAFDVTPDVNLYGKWSTGYRAGGANSRSLTYRPFNPETVSMYEVGAKSEFWDHRGRFNIAAFTGDLRDVQIDFSLVIPGQNRGTLETTNAATGKTQGVEVDFALAPVTGLTFSGSLTYTDVSFSKAFDPFLNTQSVVYPIYTPKEAASLSADYQRPVPNALFSVHIDANWAGRQYTMSTDPTLSDTSFIVNGRMALSDIQMPDGAKLQLSLWTRNLLDEQHAFERNTSALGQYAIFNEPRTFGVEGNIKF